MEKYLPRHKKYGLVPKNIFEKYSHLDRTIEFGEPFDDFHKGMIEMGQRLLDREEAFNLYLFGRAGVGKTFWTQALANGFIDEKGKAQKTVVYKNMQDLIDEIKSGFNDKYGRSWADIDSFKEMAQDVDILIIDDLGSERKTDWSDTLVYTIFNSRQRPDMSTIVVSNLEPEKLESHYDERTASRILADSKKVFWKKTEDKRMKSGNKSNF